MRDLATTCKSQVCGRNCQVQHATSAWHCPACHCYPLLPCIVRRVHITPKLPVSPQAVVHVAHVARRLIRRGVHSHGQVRVLQ